MILNAAFANHTVVALATDMTRAKMVAINKAITGRKVPRSGRFAVLNSDYFETLVNDTTLIANPGSPAATVRTGELGNVDGVGVYEYAFMPANGENLKGFVSTAEALLLATRLPTPPDTNKIGGTFEVITHPETKLSIQLRQWYDFKFGKEYRTYTLQYGVGTGDPARIERITSA